MIKPDMGLREGGSGMTSAWVRGAHSSSKIGCDTTFSLHFHYITRQRNYTKGARYFRGAPTFASETVATCHQCARSGTDRCYRTSMSPPKASASAT